MYPKVKVREQEEDDLPIFCDPEARPWQPLEAFESLRIRDLNSRVKECVEESPLSVVRIPNSDISSSAIPNSPLSRGEGKSNSKKKAAVDGKPNIRASSVPRPRAVLSSPDNDGMIGSRNKAKAELLSGLKDHNLCENRHTRCKVISRRNTVETPTTTRRESKAAADAKTTNLKERRGAALADPRQKAHLRKGKPDWV